MSPEGPTAQVLVAGIGNTWQQDDGFGSEVVKRLLARELPRGMTVLDFGTGGLDLAYEVMRGYAGLVLVDVSRQGGDAGTLYVMEPEPDDVKPIEDGEVMNPHGMDPHTVLRFVKTVSGWPGRVAIVACEPSEVEQMGIGLTPPVEEAADRAVELVIETASAILSAEPEPAREG